jgi:hypothetical protein
MASGRLAGQQDEVQADGNAHPAEPDEPGAAAPQQVYSDEEAEVIAERLAALGYIE